MKVTGLGEFWLPKYYYTVMTAQANGDELVITIIDTYLLLNLDVSLLKIDGLPLTPGLLGSDLSGPFWVRGRVWPLWKVLRACIFLVPNLEGGGWLSGFVLLRKKTENEIIIIIIIRTWNIIIMNTNWAFQEHLIIQLQLYVIDTCHKYHKLP